MSILINLFKKIRLNYLLKMNYHVYQIEYYFQIHTTAGEGLVIVCKFIFCQLALALAILLSKKLAVRKGKKYNPGNRTFKARRKISALMILQSNKELYNMMMETHWRVIFVCDVLNIYICDIINKPTKQSK